MIKDVFKFKKDSWHMKLMTFIWGFEYYEFRNMCPYFWLSVFNVVVGISIIIPGKYLVKGIRKVIDGSGQFIEDTVQVYRNRCEEADEKFRAKIREQLLNGTLSEKDDLIDLFYRSKYLDNKLPFSASMPKRLKNLIDSEVSRRAHTLWLQLGEKEREDWYYPRINERLVLSKYAAKYGAMRLKWEKEKEEREEAEKKRKAQRAVRIGQLTIMFKRLFMVIGALLGTVLVAGVGYAIYFVTKWLMRVNWPKVGYVLLQFIMIFSVIMVLIGIITLIWKLLKYLWCSYGAYCIPCAENRKTFLKVLLGIPMGIVFPIINFFPLLKPGDNDPHPGPVLWVIMWVVRGFKTLFQILKAMKDNNCPAVEWED